MKKNIAAAFATLILTLTCAVFTDAQSNTNQTNNQTNIKKLKILKKPFPASRGCTQSSGLALVRVTFDKSAKVTDAEITKSSGCKIFDDNSLEAARRIKFEPQTKDGEPVTITKPVEYKYYRY